MLKRLTRLLSIALLASPLLAQDAPRPKAEPRVHKDREATAVDNAIIKEARDNSQVMQTLDHLVNKIGPRLTGSEKLTKAQEWATGMFKSFGIDNARMDEWGEFPVGFDRTALEGRMVSPEEMKFELTTPSWTPGTNGPTKAHAVLAPTTKRELAELGDRLKGAWVVRRDVAQRRFGRNQDPESKPAAAEPADKLAAEDLDIAYKAAGILGLVSPGFSPDLVLTGGNYRITYDDLPKRTQVTIRRSQWERVVEILKEGKEVELEFNLGNHFKKGPIKLYNVIADIPGTEFPNEYVIVGGHIDSWDGATGTTDNGTGVATTIEAARLLTKAGVKPRRTIRFMLWSGEEQGLLGSAAWTAKHKDLLDNVSAVLVHDGGTNYLSGINVTQAMVDTMDLATAPVRTLNAELPFTVNIVKQLPMGVGSDHDSFLPYNVPAFFWNQSGRANYTHTHHTQYDTYDAAIPEYQQHSSMVISITAYALAMQDTKLPRPPARKTLGATYGRDMIVSEVEKGGTAEKAGLKTGDKLLSIDGVEIADRRALRAAMESDAPTKKLTVERAGQKVELVLKWEEKK